MLCRGDDRSKISDFGNERSIPTLDGWRAIAILLVLFSHGYPSVERCFGLPELKFREPIGILGVEIFFALSGYLITTKLLEEEHRNGYSSLLNFYIRRAFRILPAALLFIFSVALLSNSSVLPAISSARIRDTILFLANYTTADATYYLAHFWSLAVEEHFYFIWPAVFVLCNARHRLRVAVLLALAVALWRAVSWKFQIATDNPAKFFGRTDIEADSILWGVVLALADKKLLKRALDNGLAWISLVVVSVFAALFDASNWKISFALFSLSRATVPLMIYGTVVGASGPFGHFLETKPLQFIGRISYSLYLWQQLFLVIAVDALAKGPFGFVQLFPWNLCGALVCSLFSFALIERPLIRIGKILRRETSVAIKSY